MILACVHALPVVKENKMLLKTTRKCFPKINHRRENCDRKPRVTVKKD
jgi:hypothetical protein